RFCDALSLDSLKRDPRFLSNPDRVKNREELKKILDDFFSKKSSKIWLKLIDDAGVPCAPIQTFDDVFRDPQVLHRQMVEEIFHPKLQRKIKMIGSPIKT